MGDLRKRYLSPCGQIDADIANRVQALTVLGQPSHHQVEAAITLQHLGDRLASDSGLNHCSEVSGIEPVARGRSTVGRDREIRLTQRSIDRRIYDSAYAVHHQLDLVGDAFVGLEIVAEYLDRIRSLKPGQRLVDVVLDIL